jgi:hypothetical protein
MLPLMVASISAVICICNNDEELNNSNTFEIHQAYLGILVIDFRPSLNQHCHSCLVAVQHCPHECGTLWVDRRLLGCLNRFSSSQCKHSR